jgi:translocation and assembly module TamB
MRRRLLLVVLLILGGMVVAAATAPWWIGAVARVAVRSRGLTFGEYERIGYTRFALRDVEYRRGNVRVGISRVEAETPLLWWWHRVRRRPEAIVASTWQVEVTPRPDAPRPTTDRGWVVLRAQLRRVADRLEQWLPRATVGAGVVRWPGGDLSIGGAKWAARELVFDDLVLRGVRLDGNVAFSLDDPIRVGARLEDGAMRATLESRAAEVKGDLAIWDQPATVVAHFAPRGWLPEAAVVRASSWSLPGERLEVGQHYAVVRGSAQVEWKTDRFFADISATGVPVENRPAPPLELALRGAGDLRAFTIESLRALLPGVTATLSEPVTVERAGRIRGSGARFSIEADLGKVPWFTAEGSVAGEATLVSGAEAKPIVAFGLAAKGLRARGLALTSVDARGRLEWPRIQVQEGAMVGAEGERLTWSGGWDFRTREVVDAVIAGELHRASLARWLPEQPGFERMKLTARAAGPAASFAHRGSVEASDVKVKGLRPLAVTAEWEGRGATVDQLTAEARTGATKLAALGRLNADGLTVTSLEFTSAGNATLKLEAPATVAWKPQLRVDMLRLAGSEGSVNVAVALGDSGKVEVAARNVVSTWFDELLEKPLPSLKVNLLALVGSWKDGPMDFSLTVGAGLELGRGRVATANIAARGDRRGVRIEALRAMEADANVVNATGSLPIAITPAAAKLIAIDQNGPLSLDASVAPNSEFWQKLAEMTGVELKEPRLVAELSGTWRRPAGHATLQAARIAIDPKRLARPLPAIESLDVQVTGDRDMITLSRCVVRVENQLVRAEGRLPVPEGDWGALLEEPLNAARRGADLRVEVPDAEVAVFTRFLPAVLAPKGRLQADLRYRSGGLEGFLRLRDAASRPLGPLGVLQEVNADIAMSGRKFALRGVTAKSGGQPVSLTGTVELVDRAVPKFDLVLKGENLPFVRQTGLLVRGDLDLKLQTPNSGQPRLSGTVQLRDSLFLSDVRAFLPKGGASATRRPPYFAIETQPVNAWTLAIEVVGEEFLRLRTPVFTGVASARFRLGGTLGEPRAIGEIEIEEGTVRMPFASFSVAQGSVRLTEADPYEPTVYLRGTARRWGYDLTMEVDCSAAQPNVVFTSSPPLDSEQVLLMVMTGSAPSNEITKSATQRVANIGLYLSQSLLSSLGSDAGEADRLTISSGEKISRQGKETYDIEYRLSDRWTATGEYNEFDEYNAGVKWRIFPKKDAKEKEHAKK